MEPNRNDSNKPNGKRPKGNIWLAVVITVAVVLLISTIYNAVANSQYTHTTWTDFLKAKESNQLVEVEIRTDRVVYLTREEAAKPAAQQKACFPGLPSGERSKKIF